MQRLHCKLRGCKTVVCVAWEAVQGRCATLTRNDNLSGLGPQGRGLSALGTFEYTVEANLSDAPES